MRTTKTLLLSLLVTSIFSSCSDSNSTATTSTATTEAPKVEVVKEKMPTDLLAGKWNIDNMEVSGEEKPTEEDLKELRVNTWWQFTPDGKVSSKLMNEPFVEGTWTLSDDAKKLTVLSSLDGEITYYTMVVEKLDENNLVLNWKDEEGDMRWICKK